MSSEEEVIKLQKILAASVILVALSIGLGGFESFQTWYQIGIDLTEEDYDGDISQADYEFKFNHDGFDYKIDETTNYIDGDTYSDSYSDNIDYGDNDIFEESKDPMKNIQRGGYLVLGLILFVIWKLQEIKTESSEEIRIEIIDQISKAIKGAGALIVIISLYFIFGGAMEEDFENFFVGSTDEDGDYRSFFGLYDCENGWIDKPEFKWMGNSKVKYDESVCDSSYWDMGEAKIESSLKLGFFSFLGSLAPIYFVFNNINLNQNFASFSVPSVPNIPNQGQEIKPYSPFKENKVEAYKANEKTVYNQPEISTMAIPEDEDD